MEQSVRVSTLFKNLSLLDKIMLQVGSRWLKFPSLEWTNNQIDQDTSIAKKVSIQQILLQISIFCLLGFQVLMQFIFKTSKMKRPQSAKPGFKGYWGQVSSDDVVDNSISKNHKQNVHIMKPDMTTHDFARIKPKRIYQDKERLYSEALQLKQTVNQLMEENVRLKTKISILEKQKNKLNKEFTVESMPKGSGNSRLNIYGSKVSQKENMMVRNLKKMVRQSREEIDYLKLQNQKIKKTIKYTKINEIEIEKKIILDENKKLSQLLEQYSSQINTQNQMEAENEELKKYLEDQIEQNKDLVEDNEKFQEIVESLQDKIKTQTQKAQTKEKKLQRDLAIEKRKCTEQSRCIEDLRRQIKNLQTQQTQQQSSLKKKPVKPVMRPVSSHPANRQILQNKQLIKPPLEVETEEIKKKNIILEKELQEVKIKLQQSENELSRRNVTETAQNKYQKEGLNASLNKKQDTTKVEKTQDKIEVEKKQEKKVEDLPKPKVENVKLQQMYDLENSPQKEQQDYEYNKQFQAEPEEDEYNQSFDNVEESKQKQHLKKSKQKQEIQKMKKDFAQNDEEQKLYEKQKRGQKKKENKNNKGKGYKPDKKILSQIKELLTYRMKSQRYPFEDLKADIENAQSTSFNYSDLCNMLVNEPFYLTSNYTKAFLAYCFEKDKVNEKEVLSSLVLINKLRKVIQEFELLQEEEEKQMIMRIAEMTSTYPYQLETAFENIRNGKDTVSKKDLIQMFQKLELQDKYIELIISQLSLCSDDLEHLNFHGFFERFYVQEDGLEQTNPIVQEDSEQSYKNSSRLKKKGKNTRKESQEQDEKHFILAPQQPIENKNYVYDQDIVSDDGRI